MSTEQKFETMLWVDAAVMVENGRTAYSRRSTPPNGFEGVAWAMETLEFTGGGTVWKRAIVSEDDVYLATVKRRSTRK